MNPAKVRTFLRMHGLLLLLVAFGIGLVASLSLYDYDKPDPVTGKPLKSFDYLEDPNGLMSLEDAMVDNRYATSTSPNLNIGNSLSYWWVRIDTGSLNPSENSYYLSIFNPSVEHVDAYIPVMDHSAVQYKEQRAGWGYEFNEDDVGYLFPVFELDDGISLSHPIYIRLNSSFTQNYSIHIIPKDQYEQYKLYRMVFLGILFGILLFGMLTNLTHYLKLKDRTYLAIAIYMMSMICYNAVLIGFLRTFNRELGNRSIHWILPSGLVMFFAVLWFSWHFLKIRETQRDMIKWYGLLIAMISVNLIVFLFRFKLLPNILSMFMAFSVITFLIILTIRAYRNHVQYAKHLLAGWITLLFGYIIFSLRYWGAIPNNDVTLFIILATTVLETYYLVIALDDRIIQLNDEQMMATLTAQSAEEKAQVHETAFLQAQIKPHFLFNTLNVIATLCMIDPEEARERTLDLSEFLRHHFDFKNLSRFVPLEEEIRSIQAYVRMEQARFKDKLIVEYDFTGLENLLLPPLILQPIVENAILHGVRSKEGIGRVTVRGYRQQGKAIYQVEDNGIGISEDAVERILRGEVQSSSGVGLWNIQKRLTMLYNAKLNIESESGKGTRVTMEIPHREGGEC